MSDKIVLFLGDSFVAGSEDPEGLGWVGRVTAASHAAGLPVTAYNLGVGGETSVDVAARWRAEARPRLRPGWECGLVLSVGANDTTVEDGRRLVEEAVTLSTLATVLDDAAAMPLPAFVVGPPPAGDEEQRARICALTEPIAALCAERGVPCVSVAERLLASEAWTREAAAGDGDHPGAGGYAALAELVLASGWLDWLRALPPYGGSE